MVEAWREGRKVLVLTKRTDHLGLLREAVVRMAGEAVEEAVGDTAGEATGQAAGERAGEVPGEGLEHCFVLHGQMSRRQREAVLAELEALGPETPRVLIATGRLIGEGCQKWVSTIVDASHIESPQQEALPARRTSMTSSA